MALSTRPSPDAGELPAPARARHRWWAVAAAASALALAACGGGGTTEPAAPGAATEALPRPTAHAVVQEAADLVPADVAERGTLRVATGEGYPPFELYDAEGALVGVDPEIATAVAGALGLEPDLQVLKFDGVIPGLQGGRYDVAAIAMGITPERNAVVDFVTYFQGGASLLLPAGNPLDLTLDTLCGRTVAVQIGTIYADQYLPGFSQACTDAGEEALTVDTYPDQPQATLALSSGRADATISDVGPLAYVAQQSEGRFEVLDANYQPAPYGLALPKGSELGPAVEAAVRALVADGTYDAVLERWDVQAGAVDDPVLQRG